MARVWPVADGPESAALRYGSFSWSSAGLGEPVQQQGLGQAGPLERGQVQALVRAVGPGVRVLHAGDEDLGVGEDLGVAGDEPDRAAAADVHGGRSPRLPQKPT